MHLYIIRHSHAVASSYQLSDASRWLSARGRDTSRAVGAVLAREGIVFDAVLTSPLVRAVQTAEILASTLGYAGDIEALEELTPAGCPDRVEDEIRERGVAVAVVSHEPLVSALSAHVAGEASARSLRPAEVRLIADGASRWRLDPDQLEIAPLR